MDGKKKQKKISGEIAGELTEDQRLYVEGWAWAALFSVSIWALGNKLWWWFVGSLIPIWNIYVLIKMFLHGRRVSWEKGNWDSFEKFHHRQKQIWWATAALAIIYVLVVVISAFAGGS